jgi:hypothetical protein
MKIYLLKSELKRIYMTVLEEKINLLSDDLKKEAVDFIDFLIEKKNSIKDKEYWRDISQSSLDKIWNNDGDDVYNELLKR